jgi:hypothetical protein
MQTNETVTARVTRLALTDINDDRLDLLTVAHPFVDDALFAQIGSAIRLARKDVIVLPVHHLETMSRGRGWARCGRGDDVTWGKRVAGGYEVGPGFWSVGGHDGFARKRSTEWTVENVDVGAEIWTIAS